MRRLREHREAQRGLHVPLHASMMTVMRNETNTNKQSSAALGRADASGGRQHHYTIITRARNGKVHVMVK